MSIKKKKEELIYFNIKKDLIELYPNCKYYLVYSERSNGKTFSSLEYAIENFYKDKEQSAYIRRFEDDIKQSRVKKLFDNLLSVNKVSEITHNEYNSIVYKNKHFYLAKVEGEEKTICETPFMTLFALSQEEHYKSLAFPDVTTIIFDEFITRNYELPEEFTKFTSILSTIIRLRDNVKVLMLANSINIYRCSYFRNMGLNRVKTQKKNTIDIYNYGESDLSVAVMYADFVDKKGKRQSKPSDVYFAFDNPKLKMITNGDWELNFYPLLPVKYERKEIIYRYFINYDDEVVQCEVIEHKENDEYIYFTYIHRKTTEIKNFKNELIFTQDYNPSNRYRRKITKPQTKLEERLLWFFKTDRVYYQDNIIGELVHAYIVWCNQN